MSRTKYKHTRGIAAGMALLMSAVFCFAPQAAASVQAEEVYGEDIEWNEETYSENPSDFADLSVMDGEDEPAAELNELNEAAAPLTGTYSVGSGWSEDKTAGTQDVSVYRQDAYLNVTDTSTISCSYMDTNYSVLEYEQLRDMLTNNLLYSNVNAQISTSASYTLDKDYLYIVTVDDAALDYRDIYYYVVGDYRCFSVAVKEYRSEAEQAKASDTKTPQEMGQKISEEFVWNAF